MVKYCITWKGVDRRHSPREAVALVQGVAHVDADGDDPTEHGRVVQGGPEAVLVPQALPEVATAHDGETCGAFLLSCLFMLSL